MSNIQKAIANKYFRQNRVDEITAQGGYGGGTTMVQNKYGVWHAEHGL